MEENVEVVIKQKIILVRDHSVHLQTAEGSFVMTRKGKCAYLLSQEQWIVTVFKFVLSKYNTLYYILTFY
jgi:hypothetical protein